MTALRKLPEQSMMLDEFFAWDGGGHVGKLELVHGFVRAMAPASADHSRIQSNILVALRQQLRKTGAKRQADVKAPIVPPIGKRANARAPDIAVTCGPPKGKVFENPILIVEVISLSNEPDTWESIHALAGLASLKEIVVVQSTRIEAEVFRRGADGAWPEDGETVIAGGTLRLGSVDGDLSMQDIYQDTTLTLV